MSRSSLNYPRKCPDKGISFVQFGSHVHRATWESDVKLKTVEPLLTLGTAFLPIQFVRIVD
jgi:hypothetical protein